MALSVFWVFSLELNIIIPDGGDITFVFTEKGSWISSYKHMHMSNFPHVWSHWPQWMGLLLVIKVIHVYKCLPDGVQGPSIMQGGIKEGSFGFGPHSNPEQPQWVRDWVAGGSTVSVRLMVVCLWSEVGCLTWEENQELRDGWKTKAHLRGSRGGFEKETPLQRKARWGRTVYLVGCIWNRGWHFGGTRPI